MIEIKGREKQIVNERLRKIKELKRQNIDPYPNKFEKKDSCKNCLDYKIGEKIKTAGRIINKRVLGKIAFAKLRDFSGEIQIVLQSEKTSNEIINFFKKYIDSGDFIGITGKIFKTKTKEKSILIKNLTLLSKSVLPLPEKWHGLKDKEERYRKRYLDMILNPEVKEIFEKKEKFWEVTRNFMKENGFFEVDTPILEVTPGGADARPFITHHNDFDIDVYLRISVGELWQKRLMASNFEKTFEIGRVFRNEGSSAEHLQEFKNMEFYWAYANYKDGMNLTKKLYREIAKKVFGKTKFKRGKYEFDFSKEWKEIDYKEEILKRVGIDILKDNENKIKEKLKELKIDYDGESRERFIDSLWKYCRKNISGPAFLINHPKIISPLSKSVKQNPTLTERFQIIIAGTEVGNGYSELNDPFDQEERFEKQQDMRNKGDEEAQMADYDFIEMLKYGMPPVCGFGFGERLFSLLMDKPLRECQIFPLMKPEDKK
jgi:lysyl-tRNA synthetase, class II